MNGILNILKPPGMTSFDVVAHVRALTGTRKVGHTGTLDPLAAGVLTVCTGSATGAIEFLTDKDKLYRAELTLGVTTDTQDSTGTVISESRADLSDAEIEEVIRSFVGSYEQLPPMYSALKHNGKKLYELAREGINIERTPRRVYIYSINIVRLCRGDQWSPVQDFKTRILFDIHCSKGTYIRTLCSDIGERLGCGGHMSFLLRKKSGVFSLENALTLEDLKALAAEGRLREAVTDAEAAFFGLEAVKLDAGQEKSFMNGVRFAVMEPAASGLVRVYGRNGGFIALGELYANAGGIFLKSRKFFNA